MNGWEFAAIVAVVIGVVLLIVGPVVVVRHDSTERLRACVESGGAYVRIPETTAMECQR